MTKALMTALVFVLQATGVWAVGLDSYTFTDNYLRYATTASSEDATHLQFGNQLGANKHLVCTTDVPEGRVKCVVLNSVGKSVGSLADQGPGQVCPMTYCVFGGTCSDAFPDGC